MTKKQKKQKDKKPTTELEVHSILMDEQKKIRPEDTSFADNLSDNNKGGYAKGKERSFNKVTDEKIVDEHIEEKQKKQLTYGHEVTKLESQKREEKRFRTWKIYSKLAVRKLRKTFSKVIQSMLVNANVARDISKQKGEKPSDQLDVEKTNKKIHDRNEKKLKADQHKHVDALSAKKKDKGKGRFF